LDPLDGLKLRPTGKSLDKRGSQPTISILSRNINVKVRRIISANIINVREIRDIIEMIQFGRIFEAACKIPGRAPGVIKRNKKTLSVL
jgi:hypothetical protein